ncbi:MAG: GHKL domain-containing protein [Oscillospiraceae bacterium]|nr:GHKL domain-containing protein [Oscillospiraceae bacterium]
MEILFIDIIGAGLGIFATLLMFETFLAKKKVKRLYFLGGVLSNVVLSVVLTVFLQNTLVLPILIVILKFSLSYYFYSGVAYKVFLTLFIAAIALASEMLIGFILIQVLDIPLEYVQTNMPLYMFGVLASNLFIIFVVFMIRIFKKKKKQTADKQFNMLMAFMPIQSIILCYIVLVNSIIADEQHSLTIGLTAIFLSILLISITMIILNRYQTALTYKNEYELEQAKLKMQIDHYQDIYQEQQRVKSIRHDISNNLIAISGMLKHDNIQDAIDKIEDISETVIKTTDIVDTGLPPIDAILSAKIAKAKESGIKINYTVFIDSDLYINQFDIAAIIANALDNAIEGIQRSEGQGKEILLNLGRTADYISVLIENYSGGPVYEDYQTTKPDKNDHGFGMTQIKEVVTKYNGSFQPYYDSVEGKFTLRVMLKNKHII